MYRTIRPTTALLFVFWLAAASDSAAFAQVYHVQCECKANNDVPELGIVYGDTCEVGWTCDFSGGQDLNPDPLICVWPGAETGDVDMRVWSAPGLAYTDTCGAIADLVIDAGPGPNFVEWGLSDPCPYVLVDGTDIGATDVHLTLNLVDFDRDATLTGTLDDLLTLGGQWQLCEIGEVGLKIGTELTAQFALTGLVVFEVAPPQRPVFEKLIVGGSDRNQDNVADAIIRANAWSESTFVFRIDVNQPDLIPVQVRDRVPATWEVVSAVPDNPEDVVRLWEGPRTPHVYGGHRSTNIQWVPTDNVGRLTVTITTRHHSRHDRGPYLPHDCGKVMINEGAELLYDITLSPVMSNGKPVVTDELYIGAMKDTNHDGKIAWGGNGDEDGDGVSDAEELFLWGTDPCHPNH